MSSEKTCYPKRKFLRPWQSLAESFRQPKGRLRWPFLRWSLRIAYDKLLVPDPPRKRRQYDKATTCIWKGAKGLLHRLSSDMEGRKQKGQATCRGPKSFSPKRLEVASFCGSFGGHACRFSGRETQQIHHLQVHHAEACPCTEQHCQQYRLSNSF